MRSSRKTCTTKACPLFHLREVPYEGNKKAKVVWVGESPGYNEEKQGRPFVGDSGKLAKGVCEDVGIDWHDLFIMNSARCRINKKEMSNKEITDTLKCCRAHVSKALRFLKPKIIIVAGGFALNQIIGKGKISSVRGTWQWSEEFDCWIMPTYHPAYILRNRAFLPVFTSDLKMVVDLMDNDYELYKPDMKSFDYQLVDSIADTILKDAKPTAFDTEGQGLDWVNPEYICISASFSNKKGTAFDMLLYEETDDPRNADMSFMWPRVPEGKKKKVPTEVFVNRADNFDTKLDEIQEFVESPKIKKYTMHGSFDQHVLKTIFRRERDYELQFAGFSMDVQAAAHVFDENIFKMAKLTHLQRSFAEFKEDYNREFELNYGKDDMLSVPAESRTIYACADADVTFQVAQTLRRFFLQKSNHKMANYLARFVIPALNVMYVLEENGAHIDMDALPAVKEDVEGMMRGEQLSAIKLIPEAVRMLPDHRKKNKIKLKKDGVILTRPDFVRDTIFSKQGFRLKPLKLTKSKVPSVDKDVRQRLMDQRLPPKVRSFLEHYNQFSELHTLWSRYLKGFEKWVKDSTGQRIHSSMSLTTAVTGRAASSKPNMMNNPKRSKSAHKIRRLIAAPDGYLLLAVDESQSELRWAAHVAREREMIKIFRGGKTDIHTSTAMDLCPEDWSKLDKSEIATYRRNAKAVNFGLLFGMTVNGFVKYAKIEYGIDLSRDEAESWVMVFFRKFRNLPTYHKNIVEFCRKTGYVESPLGRRRRLPEIHSDDKFLRLEAERQAINHPIQSPSSDTVLIACSEFLKHEIDPVKCRPVLFIHDELIFEVKDNSKVSDYAELVKDLMEHPPLERDFGINLAVPLVSEPKVGPNLADMTDI